MGVLGSVVYLVWAQKLVRLRGMPVKASRRLAILERLLENRRLSAEESAKVAGRRSFAVTMSANRIGRDFIQLIYAQANDPLPGGRCSSWLLSLLRLGGEATSRHSSHLNTPQHLHANTSSVGLTQRVNPD